MGGVKDQHEWRVAVDRGLVVQPVCRHLDAIREVPAHPAAGCEDCLREGSTWVHLRACLSCGHVGCCDSSPRQHAHRHAHSADGHPVARSLEPGEGWAWCYTDELFLLPA